MSYINVIEFLKIKRLNGLLWQGYFILQYVCKLDGIFDIQLFIFVLSRKIQLRNPPKHTEKQLERIKKKNLYSLIIIIYLCFHLVFFFSFGHLISLEFNSLYALFKK